VKKLPIIGLIIGAIAAGFAILKRKKQEPASDNDPETAMGGPSNP
jgi:hypothetical protein